MTFKLLNFQISLNYSIHAKRAPGKLQTEKRMGRSLKESEIQIITIIFLRILHLHNLNYVENMLKNL